MQSGTPMHAEAVSGLRYDNVFAFEIWKKEERSLPSGYQRPGCGVPYFQWKKTVVSGRMKKSRSRNRVRKSRKSRICQALP